MEADANKKELRQCNADKLSIQDIVERQKEVKK